MSRHEISVTTIGQSSGFAVRCSCGGLLLRENHVDLADLTYLAHEHIEAADREPGYRAESAITSEDQLIDIEHGI